ncbi:MAG: hypothetical protein A2Z20_05070 [Bdellovibrionales bacterium RBG_16_40_8]|nr:MAG: hypothetical protein A2Z20_05070 [Bdellovibrionales bacterium RBG_16_40_8]
MELQELRIHDLQLIESFGEFYQHNFFKAGKSEVITLDKIAVQIAGAICGLIRDLEVDKNGIVRLNYKQLVDDLKEKFSVDLKDIHVGLLEKKGLYVKRQSADGAVYISLDWHEWDSTYKYWQIIQEIDRWNQVGYVNMNEDLNSNKKQSEAKCPGCGAELKNVGKFCAECGHKLIAA